MSTGIPPTEQTPERASGDPAAALDASRREIDDLDEQIVALFARRFEKVQNVVSLKRELGLPIYHPAREENLISRRREQAREAGLDPDHVEELYRCVLRHSRVRQTVHAAKTGVRPGAAVLLVGGGGAMGTFLGRWLAQASYEVRVLERDDWPRVGELCRGIDLALVSVPIRETVPVIERLGPFLPADCLLADLTSVKRGPMGAMLASHPGPVIGLHPLFGPSISTMDQQIVVATPGRAPDSARWLLEQLAAWGNIVLTLAAEEHDELMDLVQGARHFATFAFGRFLARRKVNLARTLEFSSPIYRLELGMVGRMFAQDPALYGSLICASPERRALLREYVESITETLRLLQGEDGAPFREEFERVADWFGPFREQAMRESTFLIHKLVERF